MLLSLSAALCAAEETVSLPDESFLIGEWVYEYTDSSNDTIKKTYTFSEEGRGQYKAENVTKNTPQSSGYIEYEFLPKGTASGYVGQINIIHFGLKRVISYYDLYIDETGAYFNQYLRDEKYYKTDNPQR